MDLSYFFLGYYEVGIKAEDFKRFFGICTYHGIVFVKMNLEECEEERQSCFCRIRCDRYEKLAEIAKKTNVELIIVKKHGMPVLLEKIKLHIWFWIGAVIALFLLISLSGRIWDIQIDGNCYYGFEEFKRFLDSKEIKASIPISQLDCGNLAAAIREQFPKITWASAEIDGCQLIIHIKENVVVETQKEDSKSNAYDLVASKEGVIQHILVRNGIAQVEVGQSVTKGDILISGWIPIKNDAAEVIAAEPIVADGDVYISCEYAYYDEIDREWFEKKVVKEQELPVLQIGSYRLELLWLTKSRYLSETNDIEEIHLEHDWKITNTFLLPIRFGKNRQIIYEKNPQAYTDVQLKEMAEYRFQEFCTNLEKKGVQIYQNDVKMDITDVSCVMSGKVSVIEKTGELKKSLLLENYGIETEE